MFEGIYFQFPKLGFILFFFLACEALCPLRINALYFPRTLLFGESETKPPLWMWMAKWAMISLLIVALMSPVRDIDEKPSGYDILLILDPAVVEAKTLTHLGAFIDGHPDERFALWIPDQTVVALTHEHEVLKSILAQSQRGADALPRNTLGHNFFATSQKGKERAILLSDDPAFAAVLPKGIHHSIVSPLRDTDLPNVLSRSVGLPILRPTRHEYEYFYIYPLFVGFLAMLAYLYGRNQKGLK